MTGHESRKSARLGWYLDGLPDDISPARPVMLECTDEDILITYMLERDEPLTKYFFADLHNPKPVLDPPTPTCGLFYGIDGPIALAGARYLPGSMGTTGTSGHIRFRWAIHGGKNLEYDRINGLKTRIQGMAEWFNLPGPEWDFLRKEDGSIAGLTATSKSLPATHLSNRLGLVIEADYVAEPIDSGMAVASPPCLKTMVDGDAPWDEHLAVHRLVADLLSIAAGGAVGFEEVWAHRTDDPLVALAGNVLGPKWSHATVPSLRPRSPRDPQRFLFTSKDLSNHAVERFMLLDHGLFHRAMDHIRGVFKARFDLLETQFSLAAMGVEHLGHAIGVEEGAWSPRAQPSYQKKAERVASLVQGVARDDWPRRMVRLYNSLKHSDRTEPDPTDLIDATQETEYVLRAWVALRLGMSPEVLADRLQCDQVWRALAIGPPIGTDVNEEFGVTTSD